MITNTFVFAFQLGDGDICYVTEEGLEKVIEPEKILGVETHSLSRKNAWEKANTICACLSIITYSLCYKIDKMRREFEELINSWDEELSTDE